MFNTGIISRARQLLDAIRYKEINYIPARLHTPGRLVPSTSQAWVGLESVILDIIQFSKIKTDKALEFGVEFGYSTAVLGNYFEQVTGVDLFTGDPHAGFYGDLFEQTRSNLTGFQNIKLVKADYRDFIKTCSESFDLIHVDIVHTYEDTLACGLWSARHSSCTIFHDTQSFPEVKKAVAEIAARTGRRFYNYRKFHGLGIVV
jgi:hypothetical protein